MRAVAVTIASLAFVGQLTARDRIQVAGYETYAVVAPAADEAEALPFAERHCAKYDRFAHFRRMDGIRAIFDCGLESTRVPPPPPPRTGGLF
jgi:hypothetical protein